MGGVDIGRQRAANVHASQHGGHGPGLVPVRARTVRARTGTSPGPETFAPVRAGLVIALTVFKKMPAL